MKAEELDPASFQIMQRWNLDNLEFVLRQASNSLIKKHAFWEYFLPQKFDGIHEAIEALVTEEDFDDFLESGMKLIWIREQEKPLDILLKILENARAEEKARGLSNILLTNYVKNVLLLQKDLKCIHKIPPIEKTMEDFFSNKLNLQACYGSEWQLYYRPQKKMA